MLLYRALLYLYPSSWRAEYGDEMCAAFDARRHDTGGIFAQLLLWLEVLPDLLTNAVAVQWDVLRQDVRYAARALGRSPGFALTAVAIAAIGIAATTAAFTMVDHVLIRPFAFANQDRLVKLREDDLSFLGRFWDVSPANYRDWKAMSTSYESMGAYKTTSAILSGASGDPQNILGASVTAELLPTLGVQAALGRVFAPEDDRDSSLRTVVLSYGLWRGQFGGDSAILGRGDGFKLGVIGIVAGIALAYETGQVLQSLLAGVEPGDPGTFAAAALLAMLMTLAGSLLPALRALRVDPTTAMRTE